MMQAIGFTALCPVDHVTAFLLGHTGFHGGPGAAPSVVTLFEVEFT